MYLFDYEKSFLRDLKKIEKSEKDYLSKIKENVKLIKNNPFSIPYEKLKGQKNYILRYEVGKKYRLIIELNQNIIIFKNILRRENSYQNY